MPTRGPGTLRTTRKPRPTTNPTAVVSPVAEEPMSPFRDAFLKRPQQFQDQALASGPSVISSNKSIVNRR